MAAEFVLPVAKSLWRMANSRFAPISGRFSPLPHLGTAGDHSNCTEGRIRGEHIDDATSLKWRQQSLFYRHALIALFKSPRTCWEIMSVMATTQQVQDLIRPLIGQGAWNVRGGYGSFLTLEFGKPHVAIREPIKPNLESSARVQRNLRRRRIFVQGDWHLWIQYCDWKISVAEGSLDSGSANISSDECLLDLDGQRLVSVESGALPNSWKFAFDLGGELELWPSVTYAPTDDLWSLHRWNGDIAALRSDGTVVFEKAAHAPGVA
jgi:hypothetical protein